MSIVSYEKPNTYIGKYISNQVKRRNVLASLQSKAIFQSIIQNRKQRVEKFPFGIQMSFVQFGADYKSTHKCN